MISAGMIEEPLDSKPNKRKGRPKKAEPVESLGYSPVETKVVIANQVICSECGKVGELSGVINAVLLKDMHKHGHERALERLNKL